MTCHDGLRPSPPYACRMLRMLQVLLLVNLDVPGGLANGTGGVVIGFVDLPTFLRMEGVALHEPRCVPQLHVG